MSYQKLNHTLTWSQTFEANHKLVSDDANYKGNIDSQAAKLTLGMYKLICFCDRLQQKLQSPWVTLSTVEVARLYLINKHHWHPTQVKDINLREALLLLQEELVELSLSDEELAPIKNWVSGLGLEVELIRAAQPAKA